MNEIKKILSMFPKKTIYLSDLEALLKPYTETYEQFSSIILQLEGEKILTMVKSKGRTGRTPSLAYQYRIDKSLLTNEYHQQLLQVRKQLHPEINIDEYFRVDSSIWQKDFPYIQKVNEYIMTNSFPKVQVPAPERSFELVGDEKWITEKGGKGVLERLGVFEKLQIVPVSDPLMLAINPEKIHDNRQLHLIVENKTTYQGLLPALQDTMFSTLIYGSGKAIVKSIEQFPNQYPVRAEHHFFYFGDIDREGISIWYSLSKRQHCVLALPFYESCLLKESVKGKEYQKERTEALEGFMAAFSLEQRSLMMAALSNGNYYPQEIIKTNELQRIWRESNWTSLILSK